MLYFYLRFLQLLLNNSCFLFFFRFILNLFRSTIVFFYAILPFNLLLLLLIRLLFLLLLYNLFLLCYFFLLLFFFRDNFLFLLLLLFLGSFFLWSFNFFLNSFSCSFLLLWGLITYVGLFFVCYIIAFLLGILRGNLEIIYYILTHFSSRISVNFISLLLLSAFLSFLIFRTLFSKGIILHFLYLNWILLLINKHIFAILFQFFIII